MCQCSVDVGPGSIMVQQLYSLIDNTGMVTYKDYLFYIGTKQEHFGHILQ